MQDNLLRGGLLMLSATMLFSVSDIMAKYITLSVPAVELATIRYAVFALMVSVPRLRRARASVRSRRPALQLLRGVGVVGSALCFVLALGYLPIAEATAINFITPLMITVLAIPVLGEVVRPQGWAAVGIGFLGVLVIVRPGMGGLHPAAGLVLLSSLLWTMSMLITRRMVGIDRASVTLFWTAWTGFALLCCLLPFFLRPITGGQFALCLMVGVIASTAQWLAVLAYRYARATVLAPLTYVQLISSAALGFAVFGAVPDRWVLIGAAIIAASGLYVVYLEKIRIAALRTGAA